MAIKKTESECCGCTACVYVCPKKAIRMLPNAVGFYYPIVDYNKCIECGLCEKICEFHKDYNLCNHFNLPIPYAIRHKNIHEIETSRSGASFIALSDWIIEQGGVVYGAGYKDHFIVSHIRAVNKIQRDVCKGSKYVQSDLTDIFPMIKEDLEQGHLVLFSGTSCQVAGLKSYINYKCSYNKHLLYTVDIVCYGVPSPKLWGDYLSYVEKRLKKKIISVNFRNKKKFGWYDQKESFIFSDGSEFDNNTYAKFFQGDYLRHSCYCCPYTNLQRVGDISLADYWGWERTDKEFNADGKGCSLLLVNSNKGQNLFDSIKCNINYIRTTIDKISQPRLECPTEVSNKISEFEYDYIRYGFVYIARKYSNLMEAFNDMPIKTRVMKKIRLYFQRFKQVINS